MKYKLLNSDQTLPNGVSLSRVIAITDFNSLDANGNSVTIHAGTKGGLVQSERNLSQLGGCWIYEGGLAIGKSTITEDAVVLDGGVVSSRGSVSGSARVGTLGVVTDAAKLGGTNVISNQTLSGVDKLL